MDELKASQERFDVVLSLMSATHERKNADYGNSFAEARKKIPNYAISKLYDKMSRLMALSRSESPPNCESIEDTLLDMACYAAMEYSERMAEKDAEGINV